MTDPYQPYRDQYGQQPGGHGPDPYGEQQNPYGGQQNPYGQPNPYGGQQNPYGPQNPYGQPGPGGGGQGGYGGQPGSGGQPGYGGQPRPGGQPGYAGQPGPYQPGQPYGSSDPPTRPIEAGQFDQPGQYQGSYGQPPGWGPAGMPGGPPPGGRPPRSKLPVILLSVLAALVVAGGAVAAIALVDDDPGSTAAPTTTIQPAPATTGGQAQTTTRPQPTTTTGETSPTKDETFEAGECATLTPEPGNRATLNETACGAEDSDVLVAKVQDSECVKDYITFSADVGKVYCLALDAEEGTCFKFDQLAKRVQDCAVGTHRVAKIFEEVTDSKRCDEVQGVDRRYAYPEPARTLCLVPSA